MSESIEVIFTEVSNAAGIELEAASGSRCMQIRAGDKLSLSDGDKLRLPVGTATLDILGHPVKVIGPAEFVLSRKLVEDTVWTWQLLLGHIWYLMSNKIGPAPSEYPSEDSVRAVAGVRG